MQYSPGKRFGRPIKYRLVIYPKIGLFSFVKLPNIDLSIRKLGNRLGVI